MLIRAAVAGGAIGSASRRARAAGSSTPSATPTSRSITGYAFNAAQQSVTLFDPSTLRIIGTYPIGAVVRWLSNEQRFWDGSLIWSYDFPQNKVQALGFDPTARRIDRRLPTDGVGPSHSLMLSPDNTQVWLNIAGGNEVVILRKANGEVIDRIKTGAFP